MTSIQVEAAQPVKVSKLPSFTSPRKVMEEGSNDETEMELPLPDVVLCSALSANILHGQRIREKRRHKATIQTKGREHLEETPLEEMMEPLAQSLSELLGSTTISMSPDPAPEKEKDEMDGGCVYHTKRRRTISNTSTASKERTNNSTASKLSTLSSVVLTSTKLKKDPALTVTIEDTPEGVFNAIRGVFKNVFSN